MCLSYELLSWTILNKIRIPDSLLKTLLFETYRIYFDEVFNKITILITLQIIFFGVHHIIWVSALK